MDDSGNALPQDFFCILRPVCKLKQQVLLLCLSHVFPSCAGTVLLDLESFDLNSIFESVVENMVITDQLSRGNKEKVVDVLLAKHRHQHQNSRLKRNFSFSSLSSFTTDNPSTPRDKDSGVESAIDVELKKVETAEQENSVTINDAIVVEEKAQGNNTTSKDSVVFEIGDIDVDDEEDNVHDLMMKETNFFDSSDDERVSFLIF